MVAANVLGVCLLGFGGFLLGVLGLLARPPGWLPRAAPLTLAGLAAAAALAGQLPHSWLVPLPLVGLGALFLVVRSPAVTRALASPRLQAAALLVVGPTLAVCWSHLPGPAVPPEGPPLANAGDEEPTPIAPVASPQAVTDAGRRVPLYRPLKRLTSLEQRAEARKTVRLFPGEIIPTRVEGADGNCHGWVFTGGRFWVQNEEVEGILRDNGYRAVTDPRAGDLVVYRNNGGQVVHSGVIAFVESWGRPLVESKWGVKGQFLHPADPRHHFASTTFYRSPRQGHRLAGLPAESGARPDALLVSN